MSKMGEEYNRRLEKYAPELLAACKDAQRWFFFMDAYIPLHSIVSGKIEKAIAKIEGMGK